MHKIHLTEQQLDVLAHKGVETGEPATDPHLSECVRCRAIFEHLTAFYCEYSNYPSHTALPAVEHLFRDLYPSVIPLALLQTVPQPSNLQPRENVTLLAAKSPERTEDEHLVAGVFGSPEHGVLIRILTVPGQTAYRLFLLFRDSQPIVQMQIEMVESDHPPTRIQVADGRTALLESDHAIDWRRVNLALLRD